nr:nucleoside triphosphate pyrophosphohydrolase [Virgibacillus chiguensis]
MSTSKDVLDRKPIHLHLTAGISPFTRLKMETSWLKTLKKKMLEEWDEYLQAADDASALEELADLLEVIHALAKTHGASLQTVETLRKEKCEERGGFDRRVFLHCRKDDI